MEKLDSSQRVDFDSGHTFANSEKHLEEIPVPVISEEIPDPDGHLSEEERKKIVRPDR